MESEMSSFHECPYRGVPLIYLTPTIFIHVHVLSTSLYTHTYTHILTANPNVRSNPSSKEVTPLHIAAGSGHLACLQLLVQLGGDIMARDTEQLTPVDYASVSGQDLCLNYLNDVLGEASGFCPLSPFSLSLSLVFLTCNGNY